MRDNTHKTTPDLQDEGIKTTVYKTKTDFLVSDRSCPKTDGLRPHHWLLSTQMSKWMYYNVTGKYDQWSARVYELSVVLPLEVLRNMLQQGRQYHILGLDNSSALAHILKP